MKITSVFLLVLMLSVFSMTVHGQVDDSLVLALSFDEGSGNKANDSSQYGNNGSITGAEWVDGKFGNALEFDGEGEDVVVVSDTPELLLLEGGTLMAWSYIMTEAGHGSWPRIMIKSVNNGGTTNGYDFLFDRANGYSIRFCVGGECNSHFPMETDAWHHVAATFDGETIKIYADGEQVNEVTQLGPVVDSTGFDLHIGSGAAFDRPFHGMLDEIRIWNVVLEEDEINWHMERGNDDVFSVEPHSKITMTWGKIKEIH